MFIKETKDLNVTKGKMYTKDGDTKDSNDTLDRRETKDKKESKGKFTIGKTIGRKNNRLKNTIEKKKGKGKKNNGLTDLTVEYWPWQ